MYQIGTSYNLHPVRKDIFNIKNLGMNKIIMIKVRNVCVIYVELIALYFPRELKYENFAFSHG